jgi:hypothetical protein
LHLFPYEHALFSAVISILCSNFPTKNQFHALIRLGGGLGFPMKKTIDYLKKVKLNVRPFQPTINTLTGSLQNDGLHRYEMDMVESLETTTTLLQHLQSHSFTTTPFTSKGDCVVVESESRYYNQQNTTSTLLLIPIDVLPKHKQQGIVMVCKDRYSIDTNSIRLDSVEQLHRLMEVQVDVDVKEQSKPFLKRKKLEFPAQWNKPCL